MNVNRMTMAGALILVAITVTFGSVKSDYQKSYDFSRLKTFAFKTERASNDPLNTNTIEAKRIQDALTAQLEALAQAKPVLMIFEDVHWIDPTSLEAVGRSVDRLRGRGVLLIIRTALNSSRRGLEGRTSLHSI